MVKHSTCFLNEKYNTCFLNARREGGKKEGRKKENEINYVVVIHIEAIYYGQVSGRRKALKKHPIAGRTWRNRQEKKNILLKRNNKTKDENEHVGLWDEVGVNSTKIR